MVSVEVAAVGGLTRLISHVDPEVWDLGQPDDAHRACRHKAAFAGAGPVKSAQRLW